MQFDPYQGANSRCCRAVVDILFRSVGGCGLGSEQSSICNKVRSLCLFSQYQWSLLELSGLASRNYQHLSPRRRNDRRLSVITSTTFLSSIGRHGLSNLQLTAMRGSISHTHWNPHPL